MIQLVKKEECCGCKACEQICPQNCIIMENDKEGFWYPQIDFSKCIKCNLCEIACPVNNLRINDRTRCYVMQSKEQNRLYNSSSGGIFSTISELVFAKEGVIFGAGFDEKWSVKHKKAISIAELQILQKSKYVQSDINNTYKEVKELLEEGIQVMYTGTPCQINGLSSFLRKDYENLILIDIICHGVPSPGLWNYYLNEYIGRKIGGVNKITKIDFRDKRFGWRNYSLGIKNGCKYLYSKTVESDPYLVAFQNNITLRPSCYQCYFHEGMRRSDITIADCWGADQIVPSWDKDDIGISLVVSHTNKGDEILESVKEQVKWEEISLENAVKYNRNYFESALKNPKREIFFREIFFGDFSKVVNKYCECSNKKKIKKEIKKVIWFLKKVIRSIKTHK